MGVPVVEGDGSGVTLVTCGGRRISIYWSPESGPEGLTRFSDGTELRGSLAAVVDGRAMGAGCSGLVSGGREVWFEGSHPRGRIVGVDRPGCVVEVTGMSGIVSGDRVVANPEGRGHSYRVEGVEDLGDGRLRLKLDVTSLLGRAPVVAAGSDRVELGRHLMARTGNLHGTRLEADGAWDEIVEAANLPSSVGGPEATVLRLRGTGGGAERVKDLRPGTWVDVVDYVVGDLLVAEPIRKA
jgi:hypothetical protein